MKVHIKVGAKQIPKARLLIAPDGHRSLVGRDWLNLLQYEFTAPHTVAGECNSTIFLVQTPDAALNQLQSKIPNAFTGPSRVKGYAIKIAP